MKFRNVLVISHRRQEAESQECLINQLQVTFAEVGAANQQQAQVGFKVQLDVFKETTSFQRHCMCLLSLKPKYRIGSHKKKCASFNLKAH